MNANSTSAQFGGVNSNIFATDYQTGTSNTTTSLDITFQATLANTGDTVYIRGYTVEVLRA